MKKIFNTRSAVVATAIAAVSGSASAAIETAEIVAAVKEAGTAAGVVGAAVLLVVVGIKAFKMIRAAM